MAKHARLNEYLFHRCHNLLDDIAEGMADEGDRVYFGSTNDADALRELAQDFKELKWADVMGDNSPDWAALQFAKEKAGFYKCDTPGLIRFYEQDYYIFSNFSAFRLNWSDICFDTSEHAYHWEKFPERQDIRNEITSAMSAHEAFKVAEQFKAHRRPDWDDVKVDIMRGIIRAKTEQHEYVRRKLLASGDRELVEDSWRDPFWGWGPKRDGLNMLGKIWMEVRAELRAAAHG